MPEFAENLWAPWRMEYISKLVGQEHGSACFLCDHYAAPAHDAANLVLKRGTRTFTLLNRFPYTGGHLMVAPAQHSAALEELADEVLLELMHAVRDAKRVLERAFKAQGFNIGINLGHCAGAGLPGHLHVHVVPRWVGDTNFMWVVGDARVIPESLERIYDRYLDAARELGF